MGRSGIDVSLLSFGTGGPTTFTDAELTDADKTRLLRRCLDHGVNLFDTSQGYGDSERFWAPRWPACRATVICCRPSGPYSQWSGPEAEPRALERAVDASLRRLRTDYVDVMFIHGLKPDDYDSVYQRHGAAIERLKQAGKIRLAGFSERMGEDLEHRVTVDAITRHPSFWTCRCCATASSTSAPATGRCRWPPSTAWR